MAQGREISIPLKTKWKRVFCFIFRHDLVKEGEHFNGQSYYGANVCMRCGFRHNWQYDL